MSNNRPEIKKIDTGRHVIEYLQYESSGPALIMLHATGFNPWLWHPLARELSKSFNVIAPYFCDHRHADPHKGGLAWSLLAEDLCALCGTLNITGPFLVGHSMGGAVITIASAWKKINPGAMVLIEPIFLPEQAYTITMTVDMHPLASKSIKRTSFWNDRDEAAEYLRSRQLFKNWDSEMLDLYIEYGMVPGKSGGLTLACHPEREAALFMGSNAMDPWPLMPTVDCPVLVLEGETSDSKTYVDFKKAASMFPKGEHYSVKGAGHLVPMEKPDEVTMLIKNFFNRIFH